MSDKCIEKGDVITCRNGHVVCEAVEDVYLDQVNWHLSFGKWRQREPVVGERMPVCEICGEAVFPFPNVWVNGVKRTFI